MTDYRTGCASCGAVPGVEECDCDYVTAMVEALAPLCKCCGTCSPGLCGGAASGMCDRVCRCDGDGWDGSDPDWDAVD